MINEIVWNESFRISREDFDHRKSICASCENFAAEKIQCKVCGCPAANFWISPESSCPAGKFSAILILETTEEKPQEGKATTIERDVRPA